MALPGHGGSAPGDAVTGGPGMRADGRPGAGEFYQRSRQFLLKPEESGREPGKKPSTDMPTEIHESNA